MTITIVADENIAGLQAFFMPHGVRLQVYPGRAIDAEKLREADALLVRSVTPVDEQLLQGTDVRFVGSCTAGFDHLDTNWLDSAGITWAYAPGCNAPAVVDYVWASLCALGVDIGNATIGVVGCGQVGARLVTLLRKLGAIVCCCDPLLAEEKKMELDPQSFVEIDELLSQSDVVCLHTPLTHDGPHPTYHMINAQNLLCLKKDAVLLNAGRGETIDNNALLHFMQGNDQLRVVLDVWEGEPDISAELLAAAHIATPHIAGYSEGGKWRGTEMIYQAFCEKFKLPQQVMEKKEMDMVLIKKSAEINIREQVLSVYDPMDDTFALKGGKPFDLLRKNYSLRKELTFN